MVICLMRTGLYDKKFVEVLEGDKVLVEVDNGKHITIYKGVVKYVDGEFRAVDLEDIQYGDPYCIYEPHNFIRLSELFGPLEYKYISNYGEVVTNKTKNLIYLEVLED